MARRRLKWEGHDRASFDEVATSTDRVSREENDQPDVDSACRESHWKVPALPDNLQDLTGQVVVDDDPPVKVGGSATVWKGVWAPVQYADATPAEAAAVKAVAVKVVLVTRENLDSGILHKRFSREVAVWTGLQHRNIVPLYGVSYDSLPPYSGGGLFPSLICPWLVRGSLNDFLAEHHQSLSSVELHRMIDDVLNGLTYLHTDRGVVHGDLSGGNVLVDHDGTCCLSDFGVSAALDVDGNSPHLTTTPTATIRWAAPELVDYGDRPPKELHSMAGDVYSCGNIMLQILSGNIPWHNVRNEFHVTMKLIQREIQPRPDTRLVSAHDWCMITMCWKSNPTERPTILELSERMSRSDDTSIPQRSAGKAVLYSVVLFVLPTHQDPPKRLNPRPSQTRPHPYERLDPSPLLLWGAQRWVHNSPSTAYFGQIGAIVHPRNTA